jgi:hypothetical protein
MAGDLWGQREASGDRCHPSRARSAKAPHSLSRNDLVGRKTLASEANSFAGREESEALAMMRLVLEASNAGTQTL